MKKKQVLFCIIISILFCFPLFTNELSLEHDTLFHLSRIVHLANAIKNSDVLPKIYFNMNQNFGYATPLFYSEIFMIPFSILYNLNIDLVICYKILILVFTIITAINMTYCTNSLFKNDQISYLAAFIYLFGNYHITNVYVRSAIGEVIAMSFLPICLLGIIEVLTFEKYNSKHLIIGFTMVTLAHNISLFIISLTFLFFIIAYINKLDKQRIMTIAKAAIITILLTSFFLLPMIEQLLDQTFVLSLYTKTDLSAYAIGIRHLLCNNTIFKTAAINQSYPAMNVSIGYFAIIFSLLTIFVKPDRLHKTLFIIGTIFMILPTIYCNWSILSVFLSAIQFPWRLEMIALLLLSVCSSITFTKIITNKKIMILTFIILTIEAIYHLYPVTQRPFTISNNTKYEQLLDGSIIDPFYSANYVRVELAGGDYLNIDHPDFRNISKCIMASDKNITCDITRNYNDMIFTIDQETEVTLPVSYYKGYVIIDQNNKSYPISSNKQGLITFNANKNTYHLIYRHTKVQIISLFISLSTLFVIIVNRARKFKS